MMTATRTFTLLPSPPLPGMPAMQTTAGAGAQAILPLPPTPGGCNGAAATPATGNGAKDVLQLPGLVAAAPAHHAAKVRCPVFLDIAPLQNGRARVHPTGHLQGRHMSSANLRAHSTLVLFAPLWPTANALVAITVTWVCRQCHHPGKPVQAGGEVDQVDPAHWWVKALLAMVPPPLLPSPP